MIYDLEWEYEIEQNKHRAKRTPKTLLNSEVNSMGELPFVRVYFGDGQEGIRFFPENIVIRKEELPPWKWEALLELMEEE